MPARILIVDDHEIVREGIRTLLAKSGEDWELCGQASDAEGAIAAAQALHPDLIVLDITMPGSSGLVAARRIRSISPATRILIFTMHEFPRLEMDVRAVGAHGYVLKSQAARDLVQAIRALLAGGSFYGGSEGPNQEGNQKENQKEDPPALRERGPGGARFKVKSGLPALTPLFPRA